ncbi:MAG: ABC transporter substrate-binding protein, partial [Gammaproteobacteria bacterium]|nr:ABC transporter substrate-binding protein [Gammaproteobacteria bacterium]
REALFLLYDFPYTNRVILHGFYDYGNSYFYNSEMAWEDLPSEGELELLEPIRDLVPPRVFTDEFVMPESSGYGTNRDNIKRALELFEEAGWVVTDGELRHVDTDEQFEVDFVFVSSMLLRALSPYAKRLEQAGIKTTSLAPEISHWLHRMRARKFDGGGYLYIPSNIPGLELRNHFSSLTADQESSQNWIGLKDPAVDYLIEKVVEARDLKSLLAATRAFDRVMLWNFYHVPGMGQPGYRAVHWNRFGEVRHEGLDRVPVIDTWWWDEEKEKRLQAGLKNLADVQ